MTFDYGLMNPPYDGSLHLKIINSILLHVLSGCVNLSPTRWLQDPLAEYKNGSPFKKFRNLRAHTKSLELIAVQDAQDFFDARIPIDLGIYVFKKETFPAIDLNTELIHKLVKFNVENPCPVEYDKKDGWRVRLPNVTCSSAAQSKPEEVKLKTLVCYDGMCKGKPWYGYFSKNQNTKETPEITCSIPFASEKQAQSFSQSLDLKVVRYYTQKTVISVDYLNLLQVFWLGEAINPRTKVKGYDSVWTDKDLERLFNLSDTEILEIENLLKKFN